MWLVALLPDKYQSNSPRALNTLPRLSLRLSRARGFVSWRVTPRSSRFGPFVGDTCSPRSRTAAIAARKRSSRESSIKQIADVVVTPLRGRADTRHAVGRVVRASVGGTRRRISEGRHLLPNAVGLR